MPNLRCVQRQGPSRTSIKLHVLTQVYVEMLSGTSSPTHLPSISEFNTLFTMHAWRLSAHERRNSWIHVASPPYFVDNLSSLFTSSHLIIKGQHQASFRCKCSNCISYLYLFRQQESYNLKFGTSIRYVNIRYFDCFFSLHSDFLLSFFCL